MLYEVITEGQRIATLPCEPRFGHMLLNAEKLEQEGMDGILSEACYLMALLEDRILTTGQLSVQLQQSVNQLKSAAQRWWQRFKPARSIPPFSHQHIDILTAFAWPDRIALCMQSTRYQLANGQRADLVPDHVCQGKSLIVAASIQQLEQGLRIFSAEPIDLETLRSVIPTLFSESVNLGWDQREQRVRAEKQSRLGEIVLQRLPVDNLTNDQKAQCLLEGIRLNGLRVLPWNEESSSLLERLRCAKAWLPEHDWPDCEEEALLAHLETWLLPYLTGFSRLDELKKLSMSEILLNLLSWNAQQVLESHIPTNFIAPTGSKIRLRYESGRPPVLSVRIQEMFGQRETPTVANGKVAVQIELLSPAHRPLQITQDLVTFWQGAYRRITSYNVCYTKLLRLVVFTQPNHIVYLCSWSLIHLSSTCNFNWFGYMMASLV